MSLVYVVTQLLLSTIYLETTLRQCFLPNLSNWIYNDTIIAAKLMYDEEPKLRNIK